MAEFVKNLDLSESFFHECVHPIMKRHYPNLKFSAGLMTACSQMLGYDDIVSTDHGWAPGSMVFLDEDDFHMRDELADVFEKNLPHEYRGYKTDAIWICTMDGVREMYIGKMPQNDTDWLTISEHRLLGLTAGRVFVDMLDIQKTRDKLAFYPQNVKLYLIASQWSIIGEEEAFVKRCAQVGDDLGSRIVCTRIAERLMRLCFLYKNRYAPYSKWFGTAFGQLSLDDIHGEITAALSADTTAKREDHILNAQILVAKLHNSCDLTEPLEIKVWEYGRDAKIISAGNFAAVVREKITNPELKNCPFIGSMSQIGNLEQLWDNPHNRDKIYQLYKRG